MKGDGLNSPADVAREVAQRAEIDGRAIWHATLTVAVNPSAIETEILEYLRNALAGWGGGLHPADAMQSGIITLAVTVARE